MGEALCKTRHMHTALMLAGTRLSEAWDCHTIYLVGQCGYIMLCSLMLTCVKAYYNIFHSCVN